jgi:hypothetical protein
LFGRAFGCGGGGGFGLGFGWEEAVVVGGDAGADGFAQGVLAEGVFEFGLG